MEKKGRLIIISGPSGSGKTTICRMLARNSKIKKSISFTTRNPRDGEREGVDYYFVEKNEFEKLVSEDKLIEYAEYCGYLYGTPIEPIQKAIEDDKIYLLAIDVKGALQIMKKMPDVTSIFITAPDDETLKLRLKNRLTDSDADINERFRTAKEEMRLSNNYDYCVTNDRLEDAVKKIEEILNL